MRGRFLGQNKEVTGHCRLDLESRSFEGPDNNSIGMTAEVILVLLQSGLFLCRYLRNIFFYLTFLIRCAC
jgi:hypothetical protein